MRRRDLQQYSLHLLLLCLLPNIRGLQVNVTIDDQYGDPSTGQTIQYNPPEAWSIGQDCTQCSAKPRPIENAYRGTWMDATYFRADRGGVGGQLVTASVPFIGTAVYVQVITTGSLNYPVGNSDFTFIIDGITAGSYQKPPDGDPSFHWNQTVFAKDALSNSLHTLTVEVGRSDNESLFLLDSIIYTKEVADSTTSTDGILTTASSSPDTKSSSDSGSVGAGVIAGSIVGGIAAAATLLAILFLLRRRRRHQSERGLLNSSDAHLTPPNSGGTFGHLGRSELAMGHIDPFIPPASSTPYRDSTISVSDSSPASNVGSQTYGYYSNPQLPISQAGNKLARYLEAGDGRDPSARPRAVPAPITAPPAYSDVAQQQ